MMYCSLCGDEIVKGGKYYIEDGKVVCQECYHERHLDDKERENAKVFGG
jgi:hypothetical protein